MFDQSASLTDIFGAQMTPGLGLVDEIIKAYKVHYFISFSFVQFVESVGWTQLAFQ